MWDEDEAIKEAIQEYVNHPRGVSSEGPWQGNARIQEHAGHNLAAALNGVKRIDKYWCVWLFNDVDRRDHDE